MQLTITKISPVYPRAVYLQWDVVPDNGVTGVYTFLIERSGSPEGPWTTVTTLTNAVNYTDSYEVPDSSSDEANLLSQQRSIYYRVTCTDPRNTVVTTLPVDLDGQNANDQAQERTGLVGLKKRKFLLRRKILRDENIAFQALNGIEIKVLKRKHFGVRCTECYDPMTRAIVKSNCKTCYGTSWVGGYFSPIGTFGRVGPSPMQTQLTNEGKTEVNYTQLTLLDYPKVEEGDVLVEVGGNHRWYVRTVNPTEIKRLVVHQRVSVVELPKGAPEYSVPV